MKITADRVRELLGYCPDTGHLIWKCRRGGKASAAGMVAGVVAAGYLKVSVDGERCQAHRLIWLHVTGEWPNGQIDHINGDRSDNRWANLRVVTNSENQQNLKGAKATSQVGLLGVSHHPGGRFRARIKAAGRVRCLGVYDTAEQAHAAYLAAKAKLHISQSPVMEAAA